MTHHEAPDNSQRSPIFEELSVGVHLPEFTRGPLLEPHLMRWSASIENWHRIHYDQPFATERDNLPGLLINGSWKQHFLVQMLRRWAEPAGWLRAVSFQFRAMDVVGSTLTAWGEIGSLCEEGRYGKVGLTIGIRNQDGAQSTPGNASVVLPLRNGPAVPYPYPRETQDESAQR
jgi:acyl dehydratase